MNGRVEVTYRGRMKKWIFFLLIAGAVIMLIAAVVYVRRRGIPFVRIQDNWSVGIYVGETPFAFHQPDFVRNPVLTVLDVHDAPARFLADPFLVREGDLWYMFFEIYRWDKEQGDISVATSKELRKWNYEQIVLDEPFHLSYPYVFEWQGDYYMIPESYEANSVRLYRAENFPFQWSYVTTLIEGKDFLDNSLVYYNSKWWLFTSFVGNKTLSLYYADDLLGPWREHPESPIVEDNIEIARPGGRMLVYEGRLFRYGQDGYPRYGNQIRVFEITELSTTAYREELFSETPVVRASGQGWNQDAMHNVDPTQLPDGQWVTSVDGSGPVRLFQLPRRFGLDRFAFRLP
jgi:hypothetical protein